MEQDEPAIYPAAKTRNAEPPVTFVQNPDEIAGSDTPLPWTPADVQASRNPRSSLVE